MVAIALAVVIYLQLRAVAVPRPGPNGGPAPRDPLDVIKTTITVAGFVGAVLVGVYGYRKQRLVEGDARRADAEQLAQRYTTAAGQLGHDKAAVRLAGVYAMARLADDWDEDEDEQRQVCIDVLCAYLRMPYETDPASEKYCEGEREVRYTIIRIIRDHLQDSDPKASTTWCGRDLDFTNATFDGGNFSGAKFIGSTVCFDNTEFIDGRVSFSDAEFGAVSSAEFGAVSFDGAKVTGGMVDFNGAEFTDGMTSFADAEFSGCTVTFFGTKFSDGAVSFYGAVFTGGTVYFCADFAGGDVTFGGTVGTYDRISFCGSKFTGSRIEWGAFEPPPEWIAPA